MYFMDIKLQALQIANDNHGNRRALCEEAGLKYEWLSKFVQGKIDNPGVNQMQKLLDWHKKKKLT